MGSAKFPKHYVIVILTFSCTRVCYIERVGFSIAYTVAADASGVNQSTKGTILSTFYYGYACSQVPGGRHVLLFSFLLWSLTSALVPLDPNGFMSLVTARLLRGVAQGCAAAGMLVLPGLVKIRGPHSIFLAEEALGVMRSLLWVKYSSDPPRSEHPKATAAGFEESLLPIKGSPNIKVGNWGYSGKTPKIPLKRIILSLPVWAIVVNNFTFHHALYVLMNWLLTYFEQGLQFSLQEMGSSKMMPYLNMFVFSNIGGVTADQWITRRTLSVMRTRKVLNTVGFLVAAFALIALPLFRTSGGAVFCSSVARGFLALGRAGFAVNHMDVAPRYVECVMGISNTT
ncbi:Anion transporter 5 like [Actinidia chinensis var. chinensis]|uniref:Anion transporter 5 like n=1 Tax=Actinidia chinensis var. chinensis TaxID=1590841 RepID=A0A2R6QQG7_ACTCC|nr:Anion transporter 5 like [Actinidia chinensis var. chinensis]